MSYLDVEKHLGQMEKTLKEKLLKEKIIDSLTGKAINIPEFHRLMDEAIRQIQEELKEMEISGHYDANTNNILWARVAVFNQMKANGVFTTIVKKHSSEEQEIIEGQDKPKTKKKVGVFTKMANLLKRRKNIQPETSVER